MKKLIIIFVLIPLLNIAQEVQKVEVIKSDTQIENLNKLLGQNEIKIDFLDFVLFPALTVGYEKSRNSSTAFCATMFINFNGDIGNDWNDKFTITPYYRFYFLESQDYGGYGVFAEIFGKLTFGENEYYDNISPNLVSDSYFDIAPGLAVGRKWINRKGFTFELMFGVGRNLLYDEKDSNRSSGTVRAGISIGKRF